MTDERETDAYPAHHSCRHTEDFEDIKKEVAELRKERGYYRKAIATLVAAVVSVGGISGSGVMRVGKFTREHFLDGVKPIEQQLKANELRINTLEQQMKWCMGKVTDK